MARLEIRCTDGEKAAWVSAAGGPGELSAWIRHRLNAVASGSTTPARVTTVADPTTAGVTHVVSEPFAGLPESRQPAGGRDAPTQVISKPLGNLPAAGKPCRHGLVNCRTCRVGRWGPGRWA